MSNACTTEVVVLGAGPGGYAAAFRAADLGLKVTLVERYPTLGGVCLNVGCIPSKALLHVAKVIEDADSMRPFGLSFAKPKIDLSKIRTWKNSVIQKLTGGLQMLAQKRKVRVIAGKAMFTDPNTLEIQTETATETLSFQHAVIACGSEPVWPAFLPEDPRIISSTGALKLAEVPKEMLILGGGIIGLEMASVYHALGTHITVVEMGERILLGADRDIVDPLSKRLTDKGYAFLLNTKVTGVTAQKEGLLVRFEGQQAPTEPKGFDCILVSVGRMPNGKRIGADQAGVQVDARGFIPVDRQLRTNVPHIFAVGDVVGQPMLAHKATAEGRVAAEVIAGKQHYFDPRCIPSVAYTDPEIAWVGLTETEAKAQNKAYETGLFPWVASGRALGQARSEGKTKLLFEPKQANGQGGRLIGAGIVGPNAGELISELALAIEMGCDAEDIALTIHPHPTLSETVMLAAEMFEGTITDLIAPKKRE